MDITTEDPVYRQFAVWGLVLAIAAALAVFVGVSAHNDAKEQRSADIRQCQMDHVRGGLSQGMAESVCGKA